MSGRLSKQRRQKVLVDLLQRDPLQTDAALARRFSVSVQTIRLDRMELGLPEMRERARDLASRVHRIKSMLVRDVVGELLDLELGKRGRSVLKTDESMAFSTNPIVRGHYLFAQANSLAVAVIDAEAALTSTARLRYLRPVCVGEKVVAQALFRQQRRRRSLVRVESTVGDEVVFTGSFVIAALGDGSERSAHPLQKGAKG